MRSSKLLTIMAIIALFVAGAPLPAARREFATTSSFLASAINKETLDVAIEVLGAAKRGDASVQIYNVDSHDRKRGKAATEIYGFETQEIQGDDTFGQTYGFEAHDRKRNKALPASTEKYAFKSQERKGHDASVQIHEFEVHDKA
ncbi:hypothetical protein B0O99DRAFT_679855 [Bisporella sp. PMI_857]|nr:hypothetical protein B0O99DRAFT_679855 [Bisporella sp. PMI_857]